MAASAQTRFHAVRERLENHVSANAVQSVLWECFLFVFKQAWACLFGGTLLILILLTKLLWPPHAWLARYDFLFLCALGLQVLLLVLRLETVSEAKVIFAFHLIGTGLEVFKTQIGSWSYPEGSIFHIGHVPLFSGFMYASVGSYLARITRILDMRYTRFPPLWIPGSLAVLTYVNFFSHHYVLDIRWLLFCGIAAAFGTTWVYFRPYRQYRRMPLLLGFMLVSLFIWIAENIATFANIWVYPQQRTSWRPVQPTKLGAWFLLMLLSFVLVCFVHRPQEPPGDDASPI